MKGNPPYELVLHWQTGPSLRHTQSPGKRERGGEGEGGREGEREGERE